MEVWSRFRANCCHAFLRSGVSCFHKLRAWEKIVRFCSSEGEGSCEGFVVRDTVKPFFVCLKVMPPILPDIEEIRGLGVHLAIFLSPFIQLGLMVVYGEGLVGRRGIDRMIVSR